MIRTALFIDADNIDTTVAAEVLRRLSLEPRWLQHRRAYGNVPKAAEYAALAREHAIRFMPSTFAGPNSTDLALAIDAVELLLRSPVDEVVIVSSDTDFSPLVVRLRELGARVIGFGQRGKSAPNVAQDYERVYEKFTVIDKPTAPAAPARKAAKPAPAASEPPVVRITALKSAAPLPAPADGDELARILRAVPALLGGKKVELSEAATQLRGAKLLSKNAPSTKLFQKHTSAFELTPAKQPNKVRYLRA